MMPEESSISRNSNHVRRLTATYRYIDELLADMENTLNISASTLAFPQYVSDLGPAERRTIEDYIGRIRAQLVRALDGVRIERPQPSIPASRSLHALLTSISIAIEELKPKYMQGYGQVSSSVAVELRGIAGELDGLVRQLDQVVTRGKGQNLQERLERLEQSGNGVELLRKLEVIISEHGFVEFRSVLSMILDRLENNGFEIAVFGRVTCGKSSLLNAILETDVLPVGVTPITAVPTRITFGESPDVEVWLASRQPEHFDVSRLPEFATEQLNAGNVKRVTKIIVRLPSPRLRGGIVFVDTPGLGSLATRGAAETLAYLPRCDLGVVLIDAGSALTQDDLHTIQLLYEAAIPASVLLSKADLLKPGDRSRVMDYLRDHLRTDLNLDLPVHAVSIMPAGKDLLAQWFAKDIAPLYIQCQELKARSVRRKAEALKRSVALALRGRLCRKYETSEKRRGQFRDVEATLRQANGRIEELRDAAGRLTDDIGRLAPLGLENAAASLLEFWSSGSATERTAQQTSLDTVARTVEERAEALWNATISLSHALTVSLRRSARDLDMADVPSEDELPSLVREMPAFDLGRINLSMKRPWLSLHVGQKVGKFILTRRLTRLAGNPLLTALTTYRELLYDWSEKTVATIRRRFDAYANSYRAQVERTIDTQELPVEQEQRMRRDLAALEGSSDEAETPQELG